MKNVVRTLRIVSMLMCARAARARDQVTPFMFLYYVYIYYEW